MMLEDKGLNRTQLRNMIETLSADLREAQAEIQRLRDENNRLKGEQGKPQIKRNTPKRARVDYSSEQERRQSKPRLKRVKRQPSRFIVNRS